MGSLDGMRGLETVPEDIAVLEGVDETFLAVAGAFGHDEPAVEVADVGVRALHFG